VSAVCPVCWQALEPPRVGRPPVVHPACRGAYEAELRRVRRIRLEAIELLDRVAELLEEAGTPRASRAVQRAILRINEAPHYLSRRARVRWWHARFPEDPGYASAVGAWSSTGGPEAP
jgi:hypothetical protein